MFTNIFKYFENDQLLNKSQIPNCNMGVCRSRHKPFCALESYKNEFGDDVLSKYPMLNLLNSIASSSIFFHFFSPFLFWH